MTRPAPTDPADPVPPGVDIAGKVLDGTAARSLPHWEAIAHDAGSASPSPWKTHGWQLAEVLVDRATHRGQAPQRRTAIRELTTGLLQSPADLNAVLRRRSLTRATADPINAQQHRALTSVLLRALTVHPWLVAGVVFQTVQGVRPGAYLWQNDPVWLDARREGVDEELLLTTSQGQGFVKGGGCVYFLGVDWDALGAGGDAEARYCDTLVDIGAVGHSLVVSAHTEGLGTRMTPALHESSTSDLFHLAPTSEMLYMLKVGVPFPT